MESGGPVIEIYTWDQVDNQRPMLPSGKRPFTDIHILDGAHRIVALKKLGITRIPFIVYREPPPSSESYETLLARVVGLPDARTTILQINHNRRIVEGKSKSWNTSTVILQQESVSLEEAYMDENEICKVCGQPATRHIGKGNYVCSCSQRPQKPQARGGEKGIPMQIPRYRDEDMPFGGHEEGYRHTSQSSYISTQCMCGDCERKKINGWKEEIEVF